MSGTDSSTQTQLEPLFRVLCVGIGTSSMRHCASDVSVISIHGQREQFGGLYDSPASDLSLIGSTLKRLRPEAFREFRDLHGFELDLNEYKLTLNCVFTKCVEFDEVIDSFFI